MATVLLPLSARPAGLAQTARGPLSPRSPGAHQKLALTTQGRFLPRDKGYPPLSLPQARDKGSQSSALRQAQDVSVERGSRVVDLCTGRRGSALTVTKTHVKVRFEQEHHPSWRYDLQATETSDEDEGERARKIEILPVARIQLWTPQWDGASSKGFAKEWSTETRAEDDALPAITCTAAQQALHEPRIRKRRLSPIPLRQNWEEYELYVESASSSCDSGDESPRRPSPGRRGVEERKVPTQLELFKQAAKTAFGGSIVAAWKMALDVRKRGKISYPELVRGGRSVGFKGNFRVLWRELVHNLPFNTTTVTLGIIDQQASELMEGFTEFFERQDMTLEDLWEMHLDADGSGRVPYEDFMSVMTGFGFRKQKCEELFKVLDYGKEMDVSMEELSLLGLRRRPALADPVINHRLLSIQKDAEARQKVQKDFHGYLVRNFGSVVRAWRQGLDSDGDGKLRFNEFCNSCKHIGFRGKLKTLWEALDTGRTGFVSLGQLDREAEILLDEFRSFLEENYRTLEDVWERILDTDKSGKCTELEFITACRRLRYPGNPLRIFKYLDVNGRRDLTLNDCEFIGMRRRIDSCPTAKQKIAERQAKDRAEAEAMLGRFKVFLSQRYGNLVRAWRRELDPDGDGRLQFTEFCQACRQMGFQGNLKALWLSLDTDDTGDISLEELDPEAVGHLEDFDRLISIFFNDLDTLWFSVLDTDGSGRCTLEEFIVGCRVMGYMRSGSQLHKYLDTWGLGVITISELNVFSLKRSEQPDKAKLTAKASGEASKMELEYVLKVSSGAGLVHGWRKFFCVGPREGHIFEEVSAEDFCNRCRKCGYKGNLLALWTELRLADADGESQDRVESGRRKSAAGSRGTRGGTRSSMAQQRKSRTSMSGGPRASMAGRASVTPRMSILQAIHLLARDGGERQVKFLGSVGLKHIHPDMQKELSHFRRMAVAKFTSSLDLWSYLLKDMHKKDKIARLRKAEFSQAVRRAIGYAGNCDLVFEACDIEQQHSISGQEFEFMQIGKTKKSIKSSEQMPSRHGSPTEEGEEWNQDEDEDEDAE